MTAVPKTTIAEADFEYVDAVATAVKPSKPIAAKPLAAKPPDVKPPAAKPIMAAVVAKPASQVAVEAVEEDDEPKLKKKKRKWAVILDNESDEDDVDPPKRAKGKSPKKSANPLLFVGLGAVGLLATGFIGTMIWYFALRDKSETVGTKTNPANGQVLPANGPVGPVVPAGWTKYEKPGYTVALPNLLGVPKFDQMRVDHDKAITESLSAGSADQITGVGIVMVTFQRELFDAMIERRELAYDEFERKHKVTVLSRNAFIVDGQTGREFKFQDVESVGYIRMVFAQGRFFTLLVSAPNWATADDMASVLRQRATDSEQRDATAASGAARPYGRGNSLRAHSFLDPTPGRQQSRERRGE